MILVPGTVDRRAVRVLRRRASPEQAQLADLHPGHSLMDSVATLDSSRVTCPEKPGSIQPAVECVSRPSLPSELLPSSGLRRCRAA